MQLIKLYTNSGIDSVQSGVDSVKNNVDKLETDIDICKKQIIESATILKDLSIKNDNLAEDIEDVRTACEFNINNTGIELHDFKEEFSNYCCGKYQEEELYRKKLKRRFFAVCIGIGVVGILAIASLALQIIQMCIGG